MGRRKPGVTDAQVQSNFANVSAEASKAEWEAFLASLTPEERADPYVAKKRGFPPAQIASGSYGVAEIPDGFSEAVTVLAIVGGIVFIIVCLNLTNLLLASAAVRRMEIDVRWSLGASRQRLIRQLLTESFLLAFVAGLLGIVFSLWPAFLFAAIREVIPIVQPSHPLSWRVVGVAFCLAMFGGMLFGLGPALRAVAPDRKTSFRRVLPFGGSRSRLARALLMAQVGLSLALLIAAGLFVKSIRNARNLDLGFKPANVGVFVINPGVQGYDDARIADLIEGISRRIAKLPEVTSVTFSDHLLLGEGWPSPTSLSVSRQDSKNQAASTDRRTVDTNFFATMGVPLRLGRLFTDRDNQGAPHVAIVNEAFVKAFFPDSNPIGASIGFGPKPQQAQLVDIVGVVGDTKTRRQIEAATPPMLYLPVLQNPIGRAVFAVRTAGAPEVVLPALRGAVQAVDPTLPVTGLFTHNFVTEWALIEPEARILSALTQIAGVLALTFAMIGLFSLMSYIVARRTTEIGIRMSLGARRVDVLVSVMRETLTLVSVGMMIGLCFAFVLTPVLNSAFLGLSPHDPATLIIVSVLTFLVAAVAGYLPARRASNVDPLIALRHE